MVKCLRTELRVHGSNPFNHKSFIIKDVHVLSLYQYFGQFIKNTQIRNQLLFFFKIFSSNFVKVMAYSSENIQDAVFTYVTAIDEISLREGVSMFSIPKSTLHDKVMINLHKVVL